MGAIGPKATEFQNALCSALQLRAAQEEAMDRCRRVRERFLTTKEDISGGRPHSAVQRAPRGSAGL